MFSNAVIRNYKIILFMVCYVNFEEIMKLVCNIDAISFILLLVDDYNALLF